MPAAPSREQCLALLKRHGLPHAIMQHSLEVSRVAIFLAEKLREAGEKVDVKVVESASLLHDIDKQLTLNNGLQHAEKSKEILEKEGFPRIAAIVAKHRLSYILHGSLDSWEEKLVYYADKRVKHDKIVSLDERIGYLLERYGSKSAKIQNTILECRPKVFALEREIFSRINADVSLRDLDEKSCSKS